MKKQNTTIFLVFSIMIFESMALMIPSTNSFSSRFPRNPKIIYDNRYDNYNSKMNNDNQHSSQISNVESDLMEFKDHFGPKVQERITQVLSVPLSQSSNLRSQYQAFKRNAYNSVNRNFDFGSDFHANIGSFEQDYGGNYETKLPSIDEGFGFQDGDFFEGDNLENSAENKDPEASDERSNERDPEYADGEDLSA